MELSGGDPDNPNYVCQTAPVYPFRDAAALWHSYGSDAYSLRQTALQVFDG